MERIQSSQTTAFAKQFMRQGFGWLWLSGYNSGLEVRRGLSRTISAWN
jgi:hypothetical protein